MTILLDPQIRDWVLLPIVFITVCIGVCRFRCAHILIIYYIETNGISAHSPLHRTLLVQLVASGPGQTDLEEMKHKWVETVLHFPPRFFMIPFAQYCMLCFLVFLFFLSAQYAVRQRLARSARMRQNGHVIDEQSIAMRVVRTFYIKHCTVHALIINEAVLHCNHHHYTPYWCMSPELFQSPQNWHFHRPVCTFTCQLACITIHCSAIIV